jgi:NAD(P)-dependent dehydrogenase (short-subunit alcohol dehydrogenase family)
MTHLDFIGRTAVVVGGSGELARRLVGELEARGATVFVASGDGDASPSGAEQLVARAARETGRVDVLVNARMPDRGGSAEETSVASFMVTVENCLASAFAAVRACLPVMRVRGHGRILNITPASGAFGVERGTASSIVAGGLMAMTRSLALDSLIDGVRVNALAPLADIPALAGLFDRDPTIERNVFTVEEVLPAALGLCHASCEVTGSVYSAGAGRFSRITASTAPGIFRSGMSDLEFSERLGEIADPQGAIQPTSARDEFLLIAV